MPNDRVLGILVSACLVQDFGKYMTTEYLGFYTSICCHTEMFKPPMMTNAWSFILLVSREGSS